MRFLLDTNIVARYGNENDPLHSVVASALEAQAASGAEPCIASQSMYELWVVATRPIQQNGLGIEPREARARVERAMQAFVLVPDPPDLLARWLDVCTLHSVRGKPAHDARLVALMLEHEITHLMTLNPADFARHSEITCLVPGEADG